MTSSAIPKDERGLVFNIQRFSIHDGPGIRTTVFMKGCPLKCLWCSNPESQDFFPNLMVRNIHCRGCGACAEACPEGAIQFSEEGGRILSWERCNHCLKCVSFCLYHSLNICGRFMNVKEVLDEVVRDEAFYRNSGGGVTLSGGEPLSQIGFVLELLRASKKAGLHTVLDTTGYAPWERIERVLPFVDLLLWDIKNLDPTAHLRTTGVDNALILENLKRVARRKEIWLRVPLISGFNDSREHIQRVALLGKEVDAKRISLLPYHEGGISKCEQLGRPYPFSGGKAPDEEHTKELKGIIEQEGLTVSIGS